LTEDLYGHPRDRGDGAWDQVMQVPNALAGAEPGGFGTSPGPSSSAASGNKGARRSRSWTTSSEHHIVDRTRPTMKEVEAVVSFVLRALGVHRVADDPLR
jgi:hypothetical protein